MQLQATIFWGFSACLFTAARWCHRSSGAASGWHGAPPQPTATVIPERTPPSCGLSWCEQALAGRRKGRGHGGGTLPQTCPTGVVCLRGRGERKEMLSEELARRLNDKEYTNWLKAGRCLVILKEALLPFVSGQMRSFHGELLDTNALLRRPCGASCRPRGNKLLQTCRMCSEWQREIVKHHRNPNPTVNWDNCYPPSWRTDHWELAKAYMPRGQAKVTSANQCDASALLNLINHCGYFRSVDPQCVREVIRCRNELMHSCELRVKDSWMKNYQIVLQFFMQQFYQVPQMAAAQQQIKEIMSIDLSIHVSGLDRVDSAAADEIQSDIVAQNVMEDDGDDSVDQWEAELLRERLQELLDAAEDDAETLDTEQLVGLSGFLQAHTDLGQRFSEELQAINSLEAQRAMS